MSSTLSARAAGESEADAQEAEGGRISVVVARPAEEESVLAGLDDPDEDVQVDAFEAALRLGTATSLERAFYWVAQAGDAVARRAWDSWPTVMPVSQIVDILAGAPGHVRVRAFELLGAPIGDLARLVDPPDPAVLQAMRQRRDLEAMPPAMLARAILGGAAYRFLDLLANKLAAVVTPSPSLAMLVLQIHRHCAGRLAAIERGAALALEERPPHHRWSARASYVRVLSECNRLRLARPRVLEDLPGDG